MSFDPLTEDFVVLAYVDHLTAKGWLVTSYCIGKQRGIDIVATKDGRTIYVEAKGARGNQSDKNVVRSMFDSGQVKDHLGKAIVKVIELHANDKTASLVILHPQTDLIRKLVDPVGELLKLKIGIDFAFIDNERRVNYL